jgi:EmrB/QacA subfamily drug resistance transporter
MQRRRFDGVVQGGDSVSTDGMMVDGAVPGMDIRQGGLGTRTQVLALSTLCVILFLTFLDNTVVSVGLANVQSSLHAGITSLQWVVNGYALTFAAFMLAGGTLGDMLGRKTIMLAGVGVFCAGSVVAALATNVDWLIAGRVIMGLGAAASEPGTLSVIRHVYPDKGTRADALGVWAAVSGVALALGPVVGGVLVGLWSWRAIFWFNLFIGAVAFAMALVFVPETSDPDGRHIDVAGIVLGALALASASFAVIQGEESGYGTWWIMLLFGAFFVLGAAFVMVERRKEHPILDMALFRRAPFSVSLYLAFAAYFGTFSIFFFTALYLQVVANATAYATALDFIPMAAGLIIASALTGPWVARRGPRVPMIVGTLLAAGGVFATSQVLSPHVTFSSLGWALPLAGIGFGIILVPVTSTPLTVVRPERSGMAASATNTSRELGAVFGVAILGALVNAQLTGQLAARLRALGIPPNIQGLVLHLITGGGLGSGASSEAAHAGKIGDKILGAAYNAFGSGLHLALHISAALLLSGAVVTVLTLHRDRGERYEL